MATMPKFQILSVTFFVLCLSFACAERDFNFNDSQILLHEPKDEPVNNRQYLQQDPYAAEVERCHYTESEIALSLVLKKHDWSDLSDNKRSKVLDKLSKFFAIPKEFITIESVTKRDLYEMQKQSLRKGNNKCHSSNKRLGRVDFMIGCGPKYFSMGEPIANQIGQQVKDGSIDSITGEKFGWWIVWRKTNKTRSQRNRRQAAEGSGENAYEDDYDYGEDEYGEDEDEETNEPVTEIPTTTTHAHRHHHGASKPDLIETSNELTNTDIAASIAAAASNTQHTNNNNNHNNNSNNKQHNIANNIDEEIVESVSQLESVITKTIENTKHLKELPVAIDVEVDVEVPPAQTSSSSSSAVAVPDTVLLDELAVIAAAAADNKDFFSSSTYTSTSADANDSGTGSNIVTPYTSNSNANAFVTTSSATSSSNHNMFVTPKLTFDASLDDFNDLTVPVNVAEVIEPTTVTLFAFEQSSSSSSLSTTATTTAPFSTLLINSMKSSAALSPTQSPSLSSSSSRSQQSPYAPYDESSSTSSVVVVSPSSPQTPSSSSSLSSSASSVSSSLSSLTLPTTTTTMQSKEETEDEEYPNYEDDSETAEPNASVLSTTASTTAALTPMLNTSTTSEAAPSSTSTTTSTTTISTTTTTAAPVSTTTVPIIASTEELETKVQNYPPMIRKRLQKFAVTSGKAFRFIVPDDTFEDAEDLSNLRLQLTDKDGNELKPSSWLQFNAETHEIYGLPLDDTVSKWQYQLSATDSGNLSVTETVEMSVQQHHGLRSVNHEISIALRINEKHMPQIDWQMQLIRAIASILGDKSTTNLVVREIRQTPQDPSTATFIFINDTLPTTECPEDELNALVKRIDVGILGDMVTPTMTIKSIRGYLIGACLKQQAPKPKTPTYMVKNQAPVSRNQVDRVNATVGHLLVYKVPSDTFYDANNEELTLTLRTMDNRDLSAHHWLQFDSKNQEFYGIPKSGDTGSAEYQLVAEDAGGLSVNDALVVVVNHAPKKDFSAYFKAYLGISHEQFNADLQRKFVERLAELFGDHSTQYIQIRSVTTHHDVGATIVNFFNTTLYRTHNQCQEEEIEAVRSVFLMQDHQLRERVKKALGAELNLTNVQVMPLGTCHTQPNIIDHDTIPTKTEQPSLKSSFAEDYMLTYILPAIIIIIMIIMAAIIACCLHRRRMSGKMELGDEEERKSFRPKGIPVIFQDELDEKPEIGNKSPIILKDEKPPLLPPSYNTSNMNGDNDVDEYVPPPAVVMGGREIRGKSPATPSYRKPPPYVSP